ncbi:hypothetical protein CerSpe_158450 [Prunus speciosa]
MANKIIEEGPWSVMGFCFSGRRWPSNLAIEEAPTHMVAYWIQVHGIPLNLMSTGNAREIGEKLVTVLEVEDPWNNGPRGFLRIHTLIDTTKPLAAGFWLPRPEGPYTWAELKYEKLSDFCFDCGRLGHIQKGCKFHPDNNEDGESAAFGDWMKARAIRERHNQVSLNVPRGVRRRAGQTSGLNLGTRVARVAQSCGEKEIAVGNNNGSWHADQSTPRAEQWSQSEGTENLMLGRQAASSSLRNKTDGRADGDLQKGDGNGQSSNLEMQLYDWNAAGVRDNPSHQNVILVHEQSPSQWAWPYGRMSPIAFEERTKWAQSQFLFGRHFINNWATPGPVREGQRSSGFENSKPPQMLEPTQVNSFNTRLKEQLPEPTINVDIAFAKMGFKREAGPG